MCGTLEFINAEHKNSCQKIFTLLLEKRLAGVIEAKHQGTIKNERTSLALVTAASYEMKDLMILVLWFRHGCMCM